ncbi:MAG: bifunctional metallophosphatase/5'-nucleotidase [Prevotella sp.]|nr:bifunctional metallophosphatase/5'-nucleotidase [Prevotella sp.]
MRKETNYGVRAKWIGSVLLALVAYHLSLISLSAQTVELKIIETSDIHGHFFPYDFVNGRALNGTSARANTYIKQQRQQYGDRLLLLDNGDILQGQPCTYWSNYVMRDDENLAAQVVNYMGYDVEAIGNHDVETGHKVYDKWIGEVQCPVIAANIIDRETRLPYVRPYAIIERNLLPPSTINHQPSTIKIAVLGMITPTIGAWLNESLWQGLEFEDMIVSARRWVKYIQQVEKPDLIIGLFHSGLNGGITMDDGLEEDATQLVAQQVDGFDAIFFGHDHQVHNEIIKSPSGREVLCLDPSCFGRNIAEATVTLTYEGGRLVDKRFKGNIVDIRNEEIDEEMVTHFQPTIDRIKDFVGRRIGTFANGCSTQDAYFGNSAFIDFIHKMQLQLTGADISLNAPLSFNASIDKGPVTVADMFKLYRYENQLYVLNMTGREIRGHLEMSYDLWVNTMQCPDDHLLLLNDASTGDQQRMGFKNLTFNFDSASGIDYEVDVTKPNGQKVSILRMSNGEPFDENKTYKVVMNSYRANGGGDLIVHGAGIPRDSLQSRIIYQSELDLRHYLMGEIERMGTVRPKAANNWKFVPEQWTKPAAKRDRQLLFGSR